MIKTFDLRILSSFFIFVFVLFLFSTESSPLYRFNYWADVNIYYTIGKSIWSGKVIYKDLFDHKGPLIFFIYGIGTIFSDKSFLGLFFLQVIFHTITLYFVYLSIKLFLNKNLSFLLSLFYPLFLLKFSGTGASAEEFILPFLVISLYYFLLYYSKREVLHPPKYMLIHGVCLACVFFIKLNIIGFWFFPLLFIFLFLLFKKEYLNFGINVLYLIGGILIITLPIFTYFIINSAFFDFIDSYINFNLVYSLFKGDSPNSSFNFILDQFLLRYRFNFIIFSIFFVGVLFFTVSSKLINKLGRVSILACFLSLLYLVMCSRNIFGYYLIVLQCFSVLGLVFIGVIIDRFLKIESLRKSLSVSIVICSVFLGSFYLKHFFDYDKKALISRNFQPDFTTLFSEKISETENPSLLLCGLDEGLYLFTKAGIVPNVRYFFYPNINYEYYPLIRDTQIQYIDNSDVDYIAISDGFRYYPAYVDHIKKNYECIAIHQEGNGPFFYLYKKK